MKPYTLPLLVAVAVARPAESQVGSGAAPEPRLAYSFAGNASGDTMGAAVASAGDVDADSIPDFIVGTPSDDTAGTNAGRVDVFSGRDGSPLHSMLGTPSAYSYNFGAAVAGAGDVDQDGYDDFVVGAPHTYGATRNSGAAYVYSGLDESVLFVFDQSGTGDLLGFSVDGAGDVNGDGHADIIVGAPSYDHVVNGPNSGSARIFSGLDGSVLHYLESMIVLEEGDGFGWSVRGIGDVDLDGYDDVVVTAPGDVTRVFSGVDGTVLYTVSQQVYEVDAAGDVNADGCPDWVASRYNGAIVFSGCDGSPIHSFTSTGGPSPSDEPTSACDCFGASVGGGGDVDGDGYDDVVIGAVQYYLGNGYARVYSGATGGPIFTVTGLTSASALGSSSDILGDLDGDGRAEVIVGAPWESQFKVGVGGGHVYSLGGCGTRSTYCTSASNSASPFGAEIWSHGSLSVATNGFSLEAGHCPPGQFGLFYYGPDAVSIPFGDGFACVAPGSLGVFRFTPIGIDASGVATFPVDFDAPPELDGEITAGSTWAFQFWYRDPPGGPAAFNLTDGLSVTFCP